jgi:hypothetical protein
MAHESTPTSLPTARAELIARHVEARRRRHAAALDSPEFRAACEEIARIEIEIARLERSAIPPLV